jgi:O-antigen/teichoic acid export membrane protein
LLGPLLYTLSEITGIGIAVVRRTKFSMLCAVIAMLCSAILNYFLVPKFGAAGAAISTAIAFQIFFTLRTVISALIWRKKFHIKAIIVMITLLAFSSLNLFWESFRAEIYCIWISLLILGFMIFNKSLKSILFLIVKREIL